MGSVLDHGEATTSGEAIDPGKVAGLPGVMDRKNGTGALGDSSLDGSGRQVSIGTHIDQDWRGAEVDDNIGGGAEGEGGEDDLVAGTNAEGSQGEVKTGGAGVNRDGVTGIHVNGEGVLKAFDLGTCGDPARAEGVCDLGDLLFADGG